MLDSPLWKIEFDDRFASEEDCRDYLWRARWPEGFRCPDCRCPNGWWSNRGTFRCAECDCHISPTSGTAFHRTRKPLSLWFRALWYVASHRGGVTAAGLSRALGLGSYATAWDWMQRMRRLMLQDEVDRLDGVVEASVAAVELTDRGKSAERRQVLVAVLAEREGNRVRRVRLRTVPDPNPASFASAVAELATPGARVIVRDSRVCAPLKRLGYQPEPVAMEGPAAGELSPVLRNVLDRLTGFLRRTYRGSVRPGHLDYYLDEFSFRFNHYEVSTPAELFDKLLRNALAPISR